MTLTFLALTQGRGFLHPREASTTKEPFHKESLQKEPGTADTEEFEKRLRILFVIWQVRLMLDKIWINQDKLEKAPAKPAKSGQEKLQAEIADNFDTGMFTPQAWLKTLQGGL